jgi:hypothetical protein
MSDQEFFRDGSHALDDLFALGRSARTVAGLLLFDTVRVRAMSFSVPCCAADRHTASMPASARQFRIHGTHRNFISEPPFSR